KFIFCIFICFNNLVIFNFTITNWTDFFVFNWRFAFFMQLPQLYIFIFSCSVHFHWYINKSKTNRSLPHRVHLLKTSFFHSLTIFRYFIQKKRKRPLSDGGTRGQVRCPSFNEEYQNEEPHGLLILAFIIGIIEKRSKEGGFAHGCDEADC